ncbi:LOW QUALITY PROTEIN: hypothetical protein V1477_000100 [Vespula maculifrons]|uniref:Uncharacterized protein n=1 Tax=Vespula maculifrons TaxID=7453 RepID=A0ABD2D3I4_VESMC
MTAGGNEWRMLDWVRSGLRLGVGGRSFSTRIGPAGVITNQDTNVINANKFQNWNDLEGKTKKEDERTNGNTKLRNVQKFEIDLLLRIADVLRFMVLLNCFFAVNQLEQRYVIPFIDEENRETKNTRKTEKSLNAFNESFGSLIKPFSFGTTVLTVSHMIAPMGETIKSFHNN